MDSCILYQNADQTITLLDIPRSIELAQGFCHQTWSMRLVSASALEEPHPLAGPERRKKGIDDTSSHTIEELILRRHIQLAWDSVNENFSGQWCLPRLVQGNEPPGPADEWEWPDTDIPREHLPEKSSICSLLRCERDEALRSALAKGSENIYHNLESTTREVHIRTPPFTISIIHDCDAAELEEAQMATPPLILYLPPLSAAIHGSIEEKRDFFRSSAPRFNLVIMDPPWPNRSARRKNDYNTRYGTRDAALLLHSIPLDNHLAEEAIVGVWVTNKPSIHDILLGPNGFFERWGLEFVEEWIWLKVTVSGQPIFPLDSSNRKPYETLLIGRKTTPHSENAEIKRRIMIGVPDLHSRKPNLKTLFEHRLPGKYKALEVFARNMTAGWWAWGNEVIKFQFEDCWIKN